VCDEVDCVMAAAFDSLYLPPKINHCNFNAVARSLPF
jgi:hypothetical protein